MQFEDLGFNHWFQERLKETQKHEYYVARVTALSRDNYTIPRFQELMRKMNLPVDEKE